MGAVLVFNAEDLKELGENVIVHMCLYKDIIISWPIMEIWVDTQDVVLRAQIDRQFKKYFHKLVWLDLMFLKVKISIIGNIECNILDVPRLVPPSDSDLSQH